MPINRRRKHCGSSAVSSLSSVVAGMAHMIDGIFPWPGPNKLVDCSFGSCWAARRLGTVAWRSWLRYDVQRFTYQPAYGMESEWQDRTAAVCVCGAKATVSIYLHQYFFLLPPTVCTIFLTTIIFFASASYWSFWPFFLNKKGVLVTIGPPEMGGRRTDQNFW
jgi:hypothetical protein